MNDVLDTGIFLSGEQYWKWRLTIEEMNIAKLRMENESNKVRIKELELMVQKLTFKSVQEKTDLVISEYHTFTKQLSDEIGIDLKGVIIDEYNYEVKTINRENGDGTNTTS